MTTKPNPSDPWKDRRPILEKSLACSLGIFLLIFLSWQSVEIKAYHPIVHETIIEVIDIPATHQDRVEAKIPDHGTPPDLEDVESEKKLELPPAIVQPPPPSPHTDDSDPEEILFADPEMIYFAESYYPEIARKAGLECDVIVFVLVDEEGNPANVKIHKSCGNAGFNEAAEEAAWKCTFKPAIQDGQFVRAWVAIPYWFRL